MGSTGKGAPNASGVSWNRRFSTNMYRYISETEQRVDIFTMAGQHESICGLWALRLKLEDVSRYHRHLVRLVLLYDFYWRTLWKIDGLYISDEEYVRRQMREGEESGDSMKSLRWDGATLRKVRDRPEMNTGWVGLRWDGATLRKVRTRPEMNTGWVGLRWDGATLRKVRTRPEMDTGWVGLGWNGMERRYAR